MFSIPFFQRRGRAGSHSEDRLARLRRVLDKIDPNRISGDWRSLSAEAALSLLEPTPPPERRGVARPQPLRFPLRSPRRIAVLRPGFTMPPNAREFPASQLAAISAYEPDALVVPLNSALLLAEQKLNGRFDLPSLQTALGVVTRIDDSPLAAHHRELLWRAFEVPVFEMLVSWDGAVIASECEVHDGLHVDTDIVIPTLRDEELLVTHLNHLEPPVVLARTGYTGLIRDGHCDCGVTSVRLLNLTAVRQRVRAAGAGSSGQ